MEPFGTETQPGTDEEEERPVRVKRPRKPTVKIHRVDEDENYPVMQRFDDTDGTGLIAAKRHVEQYHPRGSEVFVEDKDGNYMHFSADHKHQGLSDGWLPFGEDEDDD
jgi:hypothetical protein